MSEQILRELKMSGASLTDDEKRQYDDAARLQVARMQKTWINQLRSFKMRTQLLRDDPNISLGRHYGMTAYIAALDIADQELARSAEAMAVGERDAS